MTYKKIFVNPDKAMQKYIEEHNLHSDLLLYITDWKGGRIYRATSEWHLKNKGATGMTGYLYQKGTEIRYIKRLSQEYLEINAKCEQEYGDLED